MPNFPETARVTARTIELLGGKDRAREVMDAEFSTMTSRWNQDIDSIGRILRSHLFVEHYLAEYLKKANPRLGDLSDARLSFAQKLALVGNENPRLADVLPGIKHLNKVRNRLAHQLTATVTVEDGDIFLQAKFFKAMREEGAKPGAPSQRPIDILEGFAQYASSQLSSEFGEFSAAFAMALDECSPKSVT
jgi:hypothetical protein